MIQRLSPGSFDVTLNLMAFFMNDSGIGAVADSND